MKKNIISLAVLASIALPALADTTAPASSPASAPAAAPASPHTVSGNLNLVSSYRFRGIDQTFGKPALQGGVDYSHSSGVYLGTWASNVNSGAGYPGANLETDFYGGYKFAIGPLNVDLGAIYYAYPGSNAALAGGLSNPNTGKSKASGAIDNKELYLGVAWKTVSLKYSHAIADYFGVPDTKGSGYWDLSASHDLGNGWGVNGHVGYFRFKNYRTAGGATGNYTDWKVGVTKELAGWVVGLSYIGTNAKGSCSAGDFYCFGNTDNFSNATGSKNAGRDIAVLSLSKTF